ncbi:MAG TPA: DNA-deoxyinosine glycosylase [Candidatus Ornithocaccomicrobium faecavium]|uniref:DNA-deoxyinosine glycosylase n=1 Tax=Candidatus Ornithocaccomicrobium faecavium TaxID=2840890 RepID=A0A9D1P6Q6_9FIRM|nr:DNA-deoxyinosine glycosylase [Candidatus Ornithocaccomicrobium faecavium]
MERIESFAPVVSQRAKVLILGTMPSVQSLREQFYYAHPRNAFWPILSAIYGMQATDIATKRQLIERCGLALWDVAQSCERQGSLDSAMRAVRPNDIALLARQYPIEKILLNGQAAGRLFHRYFPQLAKEKTCLVLPSTSPAYTLPFEQKLFAWRDALCPHL